MNELIKTRNGLVLQLPNKEQDIKDRAYFKWLNGSQDTDYNWIEAEHEVLHEHYIRTMHNNYL